MSPPAVASVASPHRPTASGAVLRRIRSNSPSLDVSLAPLHPFSPREVCLDILVPSLFSSLSTSGNGRRDACLPPSGGTADDDSHDVAVSAAGRALADARAPVDVARIAGERVLV